MLAVQEWVESLNFINKTKYALRGSSSPPCSLLRQSLLPKKKKKKGFFEMLEEE